MQIQKSIREFIEEESVPTLSGDAMVTEALDLMKSASSACVLIVEESVLVGIFTERDFLSRVAATRRQAGETKLSDVMTRDPDALRLDDCITYVVNLMATGGYRHVPIVTAERRPVSNMSAHDVTSHLASIFAEVSDSDGGTDEWTDIGGG